eukprot:4383737-Pyramimonas_sp.AAC.1
MCIRDRYWDLAKFFDTVDPCRLAGFALKMGYPVHLLHPGIIMHEAPRILEVGGLSLISFLHA